MTTTTKGTTMTTPTALADLKAGDPVFLQSGSWTPITTPCTVTRTTATRVVVGLYHFRRADGREVGDRLSHVRLLSHADGVESYTEQELRRSNRVALGELEAAVKAAQRHAESLTADQLAAVKAATESLA